MGTRHIITVIADGKPRITQYGQWDGSPMGAGDTIAGFIETLNERDGWAEFRKRCINLTPLTLEEHEALMEPYVTTWQSPNGATVQSMTLDDDEKLQRDLPQLSRNTGAMILLLVADGTVDTVYLYDFDEGGDWGDIEYHYVINLDGDGIVTCNGRPYTFAEWISPGFMLKLENEL